MYGNIYEYLYKGVNEQTKIRVWKKGKIIEGHDPDIYRKDICGKTIRFIDHGTNGPFGWEIDHIVPKSKGGTDRLQNLQPLYWKNNRAKGVTYPWFHESGFRD